MSSAPPDGRRLLVGLDVGSTTVKAVVVDSVADKVLWQDYQRHETRQPETVLDFLTRIETEFPLQREHLRVFITGSGGSSLAPRIGAKFVQEVTAVSLAVEKLHPEAGSVVELGGQDAKIIIFKEHPETGKKTKIPSMNDKCAGGTGAVIDKIAAKLEIPAEELCEMGFDGIRLHPVAGKCGVFAETDINSLQKMGVPPDQLMASLFDAIVGQNLAVLTRGNTLRPHVILLGGPNTFIAGMAEAWRDAIPRIWRERNTPLPEGVDPKTLIEVPESSVYFAAIGAVEFGRGEEEGVGAYRGTQILRRYIDVGRIEEKQAAGAAALVEDENEVAAFVERYRPPTFEPPAFAKGQVIEGFIGLDGGSTSTKAVVMDAEQNVLVKSYQLSKGNPIVDTQEVLSDLEQQVHAQGAELSVLGIGTTGYAKDILKDAIGADVALVETVAHTESALAFYPETDVICDVGGQDIKLIILHNRQVKDFKLNTQCSAGNGYFLQSTAEGFGYGVEEYADVAFSARTMPTFGYGCAVFMQSDIVDFQRQGWRPEEIMAGLAAVLPKNIWLYVSQIPNLASLGTNFVLQGGTQHNLAAVKAQVDFIESRFAGKGTTPSVTVHRHCGESGAIGAAIEALRLWRDGRETAFIGMEGVRGISFVTHRSEDTRCHFCKNTCLRTFIDVAVDGSHVDESDRPSKIPVAPGVRRLIVGNSCERGLVEDVDAMRIIKKGMDSNRKAYPNYMRIAAERVWRSASPPNVADPPPSMPITTGQWRRKALLANRERIRIGIPRVLNLYSTNPLFSGYFESLGVHPRNLVYSSFTNDTMYKAGAKRGAVDPCFPSKVCIPHVHDLLHRVHAKNPLDLVFFPMMDALASPLSETMDCRACPTVTATPEAVKAAFTKEGDLFAELGVRYVNTFVNVDQPRLFERQMWDEFRDILGLTRAEHRRAVDAGYDALARYERELQGDARETLEGLEKDDRLGIVVLGRPYHNDPGICHEILDEFQRIGYPAFTEQSLPTDDDIVWRLFGEEVRTGLIADPMDISDVWKNSYSENTNKKVWAAKYAARHPNLVALELSSFKCGHDAPIYTTVEEIVQTSGTPYFCFKDIDENKPTGSIRIRVETIGYFLERYRQEMTRTRAKELELERRLAEFERRLRAEAASEEGAGVTPSVTGR